MNKRVAEHKEAQRRGAYSKLGTVELGENIGELGSGTRGLASANPADASAARTPSGVDGGGASQILF